MLNAHTNTSATISKNIILFSSFGEVDKSDVSQQLWQDLDIFSAFGFTTRTTLEGIAPSFDVREKPEIFRVSTQNTSVSRELSFAEEIESEITQELADSQNQSFNFLSYTEEDLIDWDAAIIPPPPRPSGTIRVKLKYKGRSKPFPVENFWEE